MKLAAEAQDEDALRWFDFLRKFLEEDESIRESIRELHSKESDLSGETLSVAAFPRTGWRGAEEIDETEVVAFRQLHRSHDLSRKTEAQRGRRGAPPTAGGRRNGRGAAGPRKGGRLHGCHLTVPAMPEGC